MDLLGNAGQVRHASYAVGTSSDMVERLLLNAYNYVAVLRTLMTFSVHKPCMQILYVIWSTSAFSSKLLRQFKI